MRIAIWYNLPSGGGKRALYDHVRGLTSRGHHVEAWCPPSADRTYLPIGTLVPEHVVGLKLTPELLAAPGFPQKLHPLRWSVRARLRAMDRHSRECARQIKAKEFDLLFSANCMFFHTPPIARFVKIPSVIYLGEPNRSFYESWPELPWLAISWNRRDLLDPRFWRRALVHRGRRRAVAVLAREERENARAFRGILVNSFFSRESVLRAFGIDSQVCYLGVDTNKFFNQNKKREPFAVSVGAVVPSKNIEFLIESLSKVAVPRRPRLLLVANAIDPPYLDRIRGEASAAGVNLEVKHRVEDSELVDMLNRARFMLYAPRLEPFGYAPLEANACGLPVIAVAEGGVRETVQDGVNGLLVEHDSQSMAAAVERLLVEDGLHACLSEAAQRLVRNTWSWSSSIDRLEKRLTDALDKARSESSIG